MQKCEKEDLDESSVKFKKENKSKAIKKKASSREITHYFTKLQKDKPINKNIPTPDKAVIEQMDLKLLKLQQEENQLCADFDEIKISRQRQKEEHQGFMNKIKCQIAAEMRKTHEGNRFFKQQNRYQVNFKQARINEIQNSMILTQQLLNKTTSIFQQHFLRKQFLQQQQQHKRQTYEHSLLIESNKLAEEEQTSYFCKEKWPIISKRYQSLQLIGKGGFSEVYKGYDLEMDEFVALKLSSLESLNMIGNRQQYLNHIKREHEIHKRLQHDNIVRLIDVIEMDSAICIVLQLCEGATLAQYLKSQGKIKEPEAKAIITQILSVVGYLSNQVPAIIHYDLKPQNIIFNRGALKVLDFGICKTIDNEHSKMALTSQGVGTYWYLPPETFAPNNPTISNKVDVWSLGVIFYEMLYGRRPFGQNLTQQGYYNGGISMASSKIDFEGQVQVSDCAKQFISSCLQVNQSARLDHLSAMHHHYFKSVQFYN